MLVWFVRYCALLSVSTVPYSQHNSTPQNPGVPCTMQCRRYRTDVKVVRFRAVLEMTTGYIRQTVSLLVPDICSQSTT